MGEISNTVKEAIQGALKLEVDGRKFFNYASQITESDQGQKMFKYLANEEVKHMEVFSKLFSKVLEGEDWKKQIKGYEQQEETPLIEELKKRLKDSTHKSEVEALSIGMQLESNAITFFEKASQDSDDPNAAKIFSEISEEEKFHYDLLQAQHDSVSKSGHWLGSAEFKMDGQW